MTDLARRAQMCGTTERRSYRIRPQDVELRSKPDGTGGDVLHFTGYASVTETPFEMWDLWGDSYSEVVSRGAFARTLNNDPDVPLLIGHDSTGIALARTKSGTLRLAEDDHGLVTEADLDPSSPMVQSLASALQRGDMDEMSFAFMVRKQSWSPDYTERRINEVDIHRGDVSMVVHGANPATAGAQLRGAALLERIDALNATELQAALARLQKRLQVVVVDTGDEGGEEETLLCPSCGQLNADDAIFCDQCGASMTAASSRSQGMSLGLARAHASRVA